MRSWLIAHVPDLLVAAVFAVLCAAVIAVLFGLFGVDSRIRSSRRRRKNKLAERSAARLRKRISDMEKYRDIFLSDKALYLATFRIVLIMLFSMCMSGVMLLFGYSELFGNFFAQMRTSLDLFSLVFLSLAGLGAWQGMRIASLDTKAKASEMVAKLNGEIEELKEKLLTLKAS